MNDMETEANGEPEQISTFAAEDEEKDVDEEQVNYLQVTELVREGWLLKKPFVGAEWKYWFFVLRGISSEDIQLLYCEEGGTVDDCKAVDLYSITEIVIPAQSPMKYPIDLVTTERTWHLAVDTEDVQQLWHKDLCICFDHVRVLTENLNAKATEAVAHRESDDSMLDEDDDNEIMPAQSEPPQDIEILDDRQRISREILTSELTYCTNLQNLQGLFSRPLKEKAIVKPQEHQTLFQLIEMITQFHETVLQDLIKKKDGCIASVFGQHADSFRCYSPYINGYDKIVFVFNTLMDENSKFSDFTEKARNEHHTDLMSLLILPVQRLPRYELLLRELAKETPEEHEEFKEVSDALEKIKNTNKYINETKRSREKQTKAMDLQNIIVGDNVPAIGIPGRTYIKTARFRCHKMRRLLPRENPLRTCSLFVFNDVVIWCDRRNRYLGTIHYATSVITAKPHVLKQSHLGFQLTDVQHAVSPLVAQCESAQQALDWIKDLKERIEQAKLEASKKRNAKTAVLGRRKTKSPHLPQRPQMPRLSIPPTPTGQSESCFKSADDTTNHGFAPVLVLPTPNAAAAKILSPAGPTAGSGTAGSPGTSTGTEAAGTEAAGTEAAGVGEAVSPTEITILPPTVPLTIHVPSKQAPHPMKPKPSPMKPTTPTTTKNPPRRPSGTKNANIRTSSPGVGVFTPNAGQNHSRQRRSSSRPRPPPRNNGESTEYPQGPTHAPSPGQKSPRLNHLPHKSTKRRTHRIRISPNPDRSDLLNSSQGRQRPGRGYRSRIRVTPKPKRRYDKKNPDSSVPPPPPRRKLINQRRSKTLPINYNEVSRNDGFDASSTKYSPTSPHGHHQIHHSSLSPTRINSNAPLTKSQFRQKYPNGVHILNSKKHKYPEFPAKEVNTNPMNTEKKAMYEPPSSEPVTNEYLTMEVVPEGCAGDESPAQSPSSSTALNGSHVSYSNYTVWSSNSQTERADSRQSPEITPLLDNIDEPSQFSTLESPEPEPKSPANVAVRPARPATVPVFSIAVSRRKPIVRRGSFSGSASRPLHSHVRSNSSDAIKSFDPPKQSIAAIYKTDNVDYSQTPPSPIISIQQVASNLRHVQIKQRKPKKFVVKLKICDACPAEGLRCDGFVPHLWKPIKCNNCFHEKHTHKE